MSEINDAALSAARYAAVIIAYHRQDLVSAVIERLRAQTRQPEMIVVVDNGGDIDEAALAGVGVAPVLIRRGDNPGYAVAVNVAAERARDAGIENLLVLTHDAVFGPTLAASLLDALGADEGAGCVAPTLRWVSRPERIFSSGGVVTRGGRAYHRTDEIRHARAVHWVDGAVLLLRLRALDAIGGMDERYFLYFEDVDTGWSLARAGWRTLVVPETAQQEPGAHPLRLGLRNMVLFARKARLPRIPVVFAVARRAAEELIVGVRRDRRLPVLDAGRGIADGLRDRRGKP
ncbi:glycosyltransferase family 2 protein [Microbacterium foliorum]|uniref:N-acetylglucosaminyl-diphospho-decaprenol L-rhamnosyltransferase n=1 Tax=Microbacterium foliorum TaxID=104336 RepID=A0A0F0KD85_9MICO|nr:glycosyltransferase family 2 protein [Microbacterium foliorum]AXL11745.1 glycosyltransferase family 2 protein [Microbacterium foliorum]KJL18130.1 N-acetylglucosaminyl-diphospho-decaprenol L-rhamnosyltransferase [Microbacterium foliorum]